MRKLFSPSPVGFVLIISSLERFAIASERAESYVGRAGVVGGWVGGERRLKRLVYKDGIIVNKYREVENTSVVSYNKEIT